MTLLIEMVVNLAMIELNFCKVFLLRKPLHRPFSPSKRLMRILRPIVEPTPGLLTVGVADLLHRSAIRSKPVGHDGLRLTVSFHEALQKFQRRGPVPLCGDHRLQDLAFVIDGPPEVAKFAVDLHERFIQMPPPLRKAAHVRRSPLADLGGEYRAEAVPPKPDGLVADADPTLRQKILDVAKRQRVLHVYQHRQTDYLWELLK